MPVKSTAQGSYRQVCVNFKDFSRTLKTFLLFSRSENLYKILIYTLKYYFGNVGLLYIKESIHKIVMPLFGAAYAAPNKDTKILY